MSESTHGANGVRIEDRRAHGLRITHTASTYAGREWHRATSEDDVVRLHFSLRGAYAVRYPVLDRSFDLVGGHFNFIHSKHFELEFVNETPELETFGVQFPIRRFVDWVDGASESASRFCERLANGQGGLFSERWSPLTPAIEHVIAQMRERRFLGRLDELFILSKSTELLAMAVDAFDSISPFETVKSSGDRERIVAARDRIVERLTDPPTLTEISRFVGLNEFKLKRGFKEMFGRTMFAYLAERRLDLALRELLDTDKTAAEIAFGLGYATPQHFGTAFKKRFGVTPKSARKNPRSVTLRGPPSAASS